MEKRKENIRQEVINILEEKFKINKELLSKENDNKVLTGEEFAFGGITLAMLLFEVEKKFHIRVEEEALDHYGFITIDAIVTVVSEATCVTK